jgi:FkbH-like protein
VSFLLRRLPDRSLTRPLIVNRGRIDIGREVTLRAGGARVRITAEPGGEIAIEDGALIDSGAALIAQRRLRIGRGVVVGPYASIAARAGDVIIDDGAHVGAGARLTGPCRVPAGEHVPAGVRLSGEEPEAVTLRAIPVVPPARTTFHAVLLADSTVDELAERLAQPDFDGLAVECEMAPFDSVVLGLMGLGRREAPPDLAVVWTRPERISATFAGLLEGRPARVEDVLAEVDAFATVVTSHAGGARYVLAPSWVLPPSRRGLGPIELRGANGTAMLMRMNLHLAEALARASNVFVLDAQRWLAAAHDGAVDARLWHGGKVAFTADVFAEAALDIRAALRAVTGAARKLVVVDLDETLWGGVLGDVGWEGLRLGGHDAAGEAFVDFQRKLLALRRRGVSLAVVSKNDEAAALEALRRHPEMVLRPDFLDAHRINWRDKAQNVLEIAQELNLGLQSVVFIDDHPAERARVREALPEVLVPEWPADPAQYVRTLELLRCFDSVGLTHEDLQRDAMLVAEKARGASRARVGSFDDWVATLGLVLHFERLGTSNLTRAAQLLNKTNQMNLRTRRLSEQELLSWSHEDAHEMWTLSVSDRFGDAGLTGLLGLAREGEDIAVADYVLSCRVMGRRIEETMVWAATRRAVALGGRRLRIRPVPTAKNRPCLDFFERAGLVRATDGYVWPLDRPQQTPSFLQIEGLA